MSSNRSSSGPAAFLLVIPHIAPSTTNLDGISSISTHVGRCLTCLILRRLRVGELVLRNLWNRLAHSVRMSTGSGKLLAVLVLVAPRGEGLFSFHAQRLYVLVTTGIVSFTASLLELRSTLLEAFTHGLISRSVEPFRRCLPSLSQNGVPFAEWCPPGYREGVAEPPPPYSTSGESGTSLPRLHTSPSVLVCT